MKALVIGASGFVGRALLQEGLSRGLDVWGTKFSSNNNDLIEIDIRKTTLLKPILTRINADVIFVPAANPFVDWCEENPKESWKINVGGIINVIKNKPKKSKVVFYSSEYVFGKDNGPFDENHTPGPLNEYGKQKLEAEKYITESGGMIIRTVWVYGNEAKGKNMAEQVINTLSKGETYITASDQYSNPTYVEDLAWASWELVLKKYSGIINVSSSKVVNRLAFAKAIAKTFNLNSKLVSGKKSAQFSYKAKRPLRGGLVTTKLESIIGKNMSSMNKGLIKMREVRCLIK